MNVFHRRPQKSAVLRVLPALTLSVLLVLSGCVAGIGGPSDQRGPVGLNVTNAANITYTFGVSVVELPANATVRRSDGLTGTVDLGAGGIATNNPGDNFTYTTVKLPDSARHHGQYTLKPGWTNRSNISDLPEDFAVVVTVRNNENNTVSWVSSTCSGDLVYLRVTMRHYGSDSAYDCDEGAF